MIIRAGKPSFTEEEKAVQKEAGQKIVEAIRKAAADLTISSFTIPKGDYGFDVGKTLIHSMPSAILLEGLNRPDDNPLTIEAEGATFWFEFLGYPCPASARSLHIKDSANLHIRGLTLDDYQNTDFEGDITRFDEKNNRIAIQLSELSLPGTEEYREKAVKGSECRIIPMKKSGSFVTPLYKIDDSWGPGSLFVNKIEPTGKENEYWLYFRADNLLKTIFTDRWKRTYGPEGTLEIGDKVSVLFAVGLFMVDNCRKMVFEGIKDYQTKGGFWENGGYGAHLWKDCYFGPRPGTPQILGGEGCMSQGLRCGSTYDGVLFHLNSDDAINIHGFWGEMLSPEGNRASFTFVPVSLLPGDVMEAYTAKGEPLGSLTVAEEPDKRVYTYNGTLDTPVTFTEPIPEKMKEKGVKFRCPNCECNHYVIRNCSFLNIYQRLLVQNGSGVIENNVFRHMGSCISIAATPSYLEGGFLGDVTVRNNVFLDCTTHPKGVVIAIESCPEWEVLTRGGDVDISNNTFISCGRALSVRNMKSAKIKDNVVVSPVICDFQPASFMDSLDVLVEVSDIQFENNRFYE